MASEDATETTARDEALERLAWLDEEFEAGRMEETEYSVQRDEQRRTLHRLMEREGV